MLKTNLKLAFRNILRNKLYASINIIGLGVASAFCILVYLYVKNEQSFDSFHHDEGQLYRVEETDMSPPTEKPGKNFFSFLMTDAEQRNLVVTPPVLAVDLKRTFPEIEAAVRLDEFGTVLIKVGDRYFNETTDNITYADADFFNVFNFPLKVGNPVNILSHQNGVVISERLAFKYFGKSNPIGRILSMPNEKNVLFTIVGIAKNFPQNSSLQYDLVIPLESNPEYQGKIKEGLNTFSMPLILKVKKGTDMTRFQQKLNVFAKSYFKPDSDDLKNKVPQPQLFLRHFADAHYNQSDAWGHYTNLKNIYQLVAITAIILFIACLNYILLTLTNTMSRSQDVGIRKTMGAGRFKIIFQYYTETQVLALISVIVGFLLAVISMPVFNSVTGASLQLSYFPLGQVAMLLFALAILLGLLAGIYPALAMSGLRPLNVMRSFSAYKLNPLLSKLLIIVQFSICIVLVISSLAINKQMNFINQTSMGFDKDRVMLIESPYEGGEKLKTKILKNEFYHYVSTEPALDGMTAASFGFGGDETYNYIINGQKTMLQGMNIDYNYFSFNKIPILQGRAFSKDISSDSIRMSIPELQKKQKASLSLRHIVVNQTLFNLLGQPKLGIINDDMGGIIIGVCKDYHIEDLTKKIMPAYHMIGRKATGEFWVRIKAGQNIPAVIEKIKHNWDQLTGNLPFTYTFTDQEVAKSYEAYLQWTQTINISCALAIIIACLGLFGLSGITTLNRAKEVGIRKVLGASVYNLFLLLNKNTLVLAFASFIIAAPIASYFVHQWLDNFAYRIKPDWVLFASAGAIALLTAVLAVSYHTIKAAMGNPVDSLRSE